MVAAGQTASPKLLKDSEVKSSLRVSLFIPIYDIVRSYDIVLYYIILHSISVQVDWSKVPGID